MEGYPEVTKEQFSGALDLLQASFEKSSLTDDEWEEIKSLIVITILYMEKIL